MDSGCHVKTYVWKPMTHRWTVGVRSKRTYVSFLFCVKRVAQLPLQELNFISQFNFSLALPDIVANKTLGESALPGNFFYQSYVSKPFASTPCLGHLALLFFICFSIVFRLCHHTGKVISSRDLPLSFTSVQWLMNVSKWYSSWKS